jgi:hypothetical protein
MVQTGRRASVSRTSQRGMKISEPLCINLTGEVDRTF